MHASADSTRHAPARRVAVAGASGLVGRALVARLCADPGVAQVHALVRRPLALPQARALPPLDEVYLALGTTIRQAGSRAAFRAIDLDATLALAQAALAAGARRVGLVSALGAEASSRVPYNRIKGEVELALAALPFSGCVIARPSLLLGDRDALGQPRRFGERMAARLDRWLRPWIPAPYRAIAADDVAAALVAAVPQATGLRVLASAQMQGAARASHTD